LIWDISDGNLVHKGESFSGVLISDSYLACKRNEMVFAQTRNVNVLYDYHLVMVLRKNSVVDYVCERKIAVAGIQEI
jgi:hypothetical protein